MLARRGPRGLAGAGFGARTPNEATWRAPTPEVFPGAELGAILLTVGLAWLTALALVLAAFGGR